jgi:chromosome segregation protein
MYLKKLDLIGFKSFADPITVTFQPGITVVVGPNGCGKSNIVDAILWVLGEQSTKTLRSDRMEDVIFNGSETRKPISMAEVILTVGGVTPEEIDNRFGEFRELSLCRRLFRSGESEYLINRIPCRLRDIRDVLIDTGAGHKGHTIIEQGKVDQLLNASPLDRRVLIEETAGISKYKIRKAEAERKLESTQQNLLRVRDIISEVKRQIQGLDRQVKKTQTYNALRDEAQHLEMLLLTHEYRTVHHDWEVVSGQAEEARVAESGLLSQLSSIDADIQKAKTELVQEEHGLTGMRQQVFDRKTQIHQQENRIELLRNQILTWEEQLAQFMQEKDQLGQAQDRTLKQSDELCLQQEAVQQSLKGLQKQLENHDLAKNKLDSRMAQMETAVEGDKNHLFSLLSLMTEAKNQAAAMESRCREILRVQEKSRTELTAVMVQVQQTQKGLEDEKSVLVSLEKNIAEAQHRKQRLTESIYQKRESLAQMDTEANRLRDELTRVETRLSSATEHEKNLMAAQTSLQDHLSGQPGLLNRFSGIVADGFSVEKKYEKAIEAVLGDRLQALITDDHASIQQAIRHFKANDAPRSVFVPKTLRMKPGISGITAREGIIGPAVAYVTARPGFESLAQALLGGVILVQDLDTAITIWKEKPLSEILVTLDGEVVFPSGMVVGGQTKNDPQGFLQTRRRLKELGEEIQRLTSELAQVEEDRGRQKADLERLTSEEEQQVQKQHQTELEATAQRQKGAALERQMETLTEHRSLLEMEEHHRLQEIRDLENGMEEVKRRIQDLEIQHAQLQNKMTQTQEERKQYEAQRMNLSSEHTQLKVDFTSLTERREIMVREIQRLQQEQLHLSKRREQRQIDADGLKARIQAARRDMKETETTISTLAKELALIEASVIEKTQKYTNELNRLKQLEEQQGGVRGEWSRIERSLKNLEVREAELRTKLEHLNEQLNTTCSIPPEKALHKLDQETIHPEEAGARLSELKIKLEQMGPVNLAAPEEYKELEERYQFLTTQEADLTRSVEDLQKAIHKISRTTREMFLKAFQELRVKFSEVFSTFFEGGRADLLLQDESKPLETGIEIIAQPPGKRLRSITLLSGGEKALTAISLLFASFLIHPSPFCILDEIDAPLDEENTRRFLRVLHQMTNHSQFLVITHNKRTMEQADILYGVTMQEAGVSTVVSVKLESSGNGHGGKRRQLKEIVSPSAAV